MFPTKAKAKSRFPIPSKAKESCAEDKEQEAGFGRHRSSLCVAMCFPGRTLDERDAGQG